MDSSSLQRAVLLGLLAALGGALPAAGAANGPHAEITAPAAGFKLRAGQTMAVRVRVQAGAEPLRAWVLRLHGAGDTDAHELARGASGVDDQAVAQVVADDLVAGKGYSLELVVEDGVGATARAEVSFRIPDPQYAVIPIDPGNFSRNIYSVGLVDGSGTLVAAATEDFEELRLIDTVTGRERRLRVPDRASEGQQLSADGRRFYFRGAFLQPFLDAIGFVDLAGEKVTIGPATGSELFTVDRTGRHVAFQSSEDLDPWVGNAEHKTQYFLWDVDTREVRQLTTDPQAIVWSPEDRTLCPWKLGTMPLITADGNRIVVITSVPLGTRPADPDIGCYVLVYDIATAAWRYAAGLPRGTALDRATLSDDGRYVSFGSVRSVLPYSFPALLDLETGEPTDPAGGITDYPSFDAVISRDGARIVISSQSDLDARVGNPDHNMELFVYDRATGQFTQITETEGGIGLRSSGFCFPYRPRVNDDARVVAFEFAVPPAFGGCYLQGPQRHEPDGFAFGRVRAVRKRAGNGAPALGGHFSVWVVAGETLTLDFTATDPDGDPITFFAQEVGVQELPPPGRPDVPPGSEIIDHRDGTATFRWPTTRRHLGTHTLRVAAFDEGGGEVFQDVRITVAATPCAGDCNADGYVTIDELVSAVSTALGRMSPDICTNADADGSGAVTIDELVRATSAALNGCA